jgi:hypothetical protein
MSAGQFVRGRARVLGFVAFLALVAAGIALSAIFGGYALPQSAQPAVPEAGEAPAEVIGLGSQLQARSSAPFASAAPGAKAAGLAQKGKLSTKPGNWVPVGQTPMRSDDATYSISRLGHGTLSGRATSLADDPSHPGHHFLSAAGGGVWETVDDGDTWTSIGEALPTQNFGALGYSAASHTLIAATGDNAFAGTAFTGLGIFRTTDGKKWTKSTGVPDEITSFRVAFDPADATGKTVYAATSKGLFRSTDAGASWVNEQLPTSPVCAGNTTDLHCFFANIVTDVIVRSTGHAVLAAVGWRAGRALNRGDATVQSPGNGLYVSNTGAPGTFTFIDAGESAPSRNGFATNPVVGRTALAAAHGPDQNPDAVYAIVEDAQKFQSCVDVVDIEPVCDSTVGPVSQGGSVLDGAYMSRDFGRTWTKIMDWTQLKAPGTNSSLGGVSAQPTYSPGVQSWYNLWIDADPTATAPVTGLPTRVLFGLEEVWENATYPVPVVGPTDWRVIGRYWNACFGGVTLTSGYQCNGTESPIAGTTTHPDQHAALFVPDGSGGVKLFVGNDGGVYKQAAPAGDDFDNASWGNGSNVGLNTLQPYDAAIARDGTIVAGLQDNGVVEIEAGTRRSVAIFGGDGFDIGIDPDNSSNIVEEYAAGVVSVTSDGGRNWTQVNPALTAAQFWTPLVVNPSDAKNFLIGGRTIKERTLGYSSTAGWTQLYDLGTAPSGANRQASALDINGADGKKTMYVGFCGYCDVVTQGVPFDNGVATNAGGTWHMAAAAGLPKRYITSIRIDPANVRAVYVTLGGYGRKWVPPGAEGEDTSQVGEGHVFKSIDGGESFVDISGNLPDVPANWTLVRNGQLIVATDIGVFSSGDTSGGTYSVLGKNLPASPVLKLRLQPGDPDNLIAVTFGRGVYSFRFTKATATTAGPAQPSIQGDVTTLAAAADAENDLQSVAGATFPFDVQSGFDNARLTADAGYTGPADVDLYLQQQQPDGSWADVASAISSRLDGESLQYGLPAPGHYRLLVEEYLGAPLLNVHLAIGFYNSLNQRGS